MDDAYVTVGKLTKPHGVRGLAKLISFTDPPENIFTYASLFSHVDGNELKLEKKSSNGVEGFLVGIQGITDRSMLESILPIELQIRRSMMIEITDQSDGFYYSDLMGLSIIAQDNKSLGQVIQVVSYGAQDNLEVESASGTKYYVPFTKHAVLDVDIVKGQITINPIYLIAQKIPQNPKAESESVEDED